MPKRSKLFRFVDGKVVEVQKQAPAFRPRYPLACEALSVHPTDIGAAIEFDRANGVPTDYREDGTPLMQDSRHYKKYRRLHGFYDRSGFES